MEKVNTSTTSEKKSLIENVDMKITVPTLGILFAVIAWIFADNANVTPKLNAIITYYAETFGWLYLLLGLFLLFASGYLCFSKFGDVKIGGKDEKAEYSNGAYFAILFSSALGAGICIWGLAEPLYFQNMSIGGLEAGSAAMTEKALSYAFLHWGWIPWAFYGFPGMIYGYYVHSKKMIPRLSAPLISLVGEKYADAWWIKVIEILLLLACISGAPILICNGVYLVLAGLEVRFGIATSTLTKSLAAAFLAVVVLWSATHDIKKGLGVISSFNIKLCFGIMIFIFVVSDMNFIMHIGTSAMGDLLTNFFRMTLWSDPVGGEGFPQAWTIIYWIWWLVGSFLVGFVFANLCKGRTFKQALLPIIGVSPVVAFAWFSVWGGSAFARDMNLGTDYVGLVHEVGQNYAGFHFLMDLPLGSIVVVLYTLLIAVFVITTADSYCICFAQLSTKDEYYIKNKGKTIEPPAIMRIAYALVTILMSYLFLLANIDFSGVNALGAIATFPCIFLLLIFIYAFFRDLNIDYNKEHGIVKESKAKEVTAE